MKLRIKKRSQAEYLITHIFILPFAFWFLMEILHLPSIVKYTIDVAWVLLLFLMVVNRIPMPNKESRKLLHVVLLFFASTLIGVAINTFSPLYFLWGLRNNIRFFVFFFACVLYLDEADVAKFLSVFDKLFWINFIVTLYQFFVQEKLQDHLGGIFGVEKGCNGYTNMFMLIVLMKSILLYLNKKESLRSCLLKCSAAFLIAALAELKVFFLEMAVVVIMAIMLERFSARKILITLVLMGVAMVAVEILTYFAPVFSDWFNLESMLATATSQSGYTGSNDMNRLTAISMSWERFLRTWPNKFFGLGLGNCDYAAAFSFLSTPFYLAYNQLNYTWFMSAFLILETGAVGLVLYMLFFVHIFFYTTMYGKEHAEMNVYVRMAQIMSVLCMIMVIYNASMRTEAAYMAYFILALPFIKKRQAA